MMIKLSKLRLRLVALLLVGYLFGFSALALLVDVEDPIASDEATISTGADVKPSTISNKNDGTFFRHKTVIIPHDKKKHRGGEDAAAASDRILVVADGVGGWASHGVNPGLFSKLLVKTIVKDYDSAIEGTSPADIDLIGLVHKANWEAGSKHMGSATCTVVTLAGPNRLRTLNIGDSGYAIFRASGTGDSSSVALLYASVPGQKQFNFPDQIGARHGDVVAEVAQMETHQIDDDDIVVVYSDGVSDNLDPEDFIPCISPYLEFNASGKGASVTDYSLAADCIARLSYELGKDRTFDSPFSIGAREAGWGKGYIGGKHDDISVVVAQMQASGADSKEKSNNFTEAPHFAESVYLYKGHVPPLSKLPGLNGSDQAVKPTKARESRRPKANQGEDEL